MPFIWESRSADANAVRTALSQAFPDMFLMLNDVVEAGVKTLRVDAEDTQLEGDAIALRCVDMYRAAKAVSRKPVDLRVKGHDGDQCWANPAFDNPFPPGLGHSLGQWVMGLSVRGLVLVTDSPLRSVLSVDAVRQLDQSSEGKESDGAG